MTPHDKRGLWTAKRGSVFSMSLAIVGAVTLVLGLTQRSAPPAAPLPAASTAPAVSPATPNNSISPTINTTAASQTTLGSPHHAWPPIEAHQPGTAWVRQAARSTTTTEPIGSPAGPAHANPAQAGAADTLSIPNLGQWDIPVTAATQTSQGVLEPPADVHTVGTWLSGAQLAATQGTIDIIGHVNYSGQGPGALHDIAALHPGDRLSTTDRHRHTTTWMVTSVQARSKSAGVDPTAFPGPTGPRQLILITCGGAFDARGHTYLDNVYVRAQPSQDSVRRP